MTEFFSALVRDIAAYFNAPLNFGGVLVTGKIIISAILIGFAVCALLSFFNKLFLGSFVQYIISSHADSPESAVSANEKIKPGFFVRTALSRNGVFAKIVKCANPEETDPDKRSFYILPADSERAQNLYIKGANVRTLLITFIVLIILAALAYKVLPALIDMSRDFANSFKTDGNIA